MSKGSKPKKQKVPKLTEAEYAAYLSALRELSEGNNPVISPKQNEGKDEQKKAGLHAPFFIVKNFFMIFSKKCKKTVDKHFSFQYYDKAVLRGA